MLNFKELLVQRKLYLLDAYVSAARAVCYSLAFKVQPLLYDHPVPFIIER